MSRRYTIVFVEPESRGYLWDVTAGHLPVWLLYSRSGGACRDLLSADLPVGGDCLWSGFTKLVPELLIILCSVRIREQGKGTFCYWYIIPRGYRRIEGLKGDDLLLEIPIHV